MATLPEANDIIFGPVTDSLSAWTCENEGTVTREFKSPAPRELGQAVQKLLSAKLGEENAQVWTKPNGSFTIVVRNPALHHAGHLINTDDTAGSAHYGGPFGNTAFNNEILARLPPDAYSGKLVSKEDLAVAEQIIFGPPNEKYNIGKWRYNEDGMHHPDDGHGFYTKKVGPPVPDSLYAAVSYLLVKNKISNLTNDRNAAIYHQFDRSFSIELGKAAFDRDIRPKLQEKTETEGKFGLMARAEEALKALDVSAVSLGRDTVSVRFSADRSVRKGMQYLLKSKNLEFDISDGLTNWNPHYSYFSVNKTDFEKHVAPLMGIQRAV